MEKVGKKMDGLLLGEKKMVGIFLILLAFGIGVPSSQAQGVVTMTLNPVTGGFSMAIPVDTASTLNFQGTRAQNGDFSGTIQLAGGTQTFSLEMARTTVGANVTINYGSYGTMELFVPDLGDPTLSNTTIGSGQCSSLFSDPVYVAIRQSFFKLMVEGRNWTTTPQKGEILKLLENMFQYVTSPRIISDCEYLTQALDKKGCDIDTIFKKWSCTEHGACCDAHDDCYARNGCSAFSWFGTYLYAEPDIVENDSPCAQCNIEAVRCWRTNPGKSRCCDAGDCGEENRIFNGFPVLIRSGF